MNITILIVAAAILLFLGIFAVIYGILKRGLKVKERIAGRPDPKPQEEEGSTKQRIVEQAAEFFKPIGEMVPRSPEDLSNEAQRMVQAGIRRKDAVVLFYGVRVATSLLLFVLLLVTRVFPGNLLLVIVLSVFLGAFLPDLWLRWKIGKRQEQIQFGLADMMDLSVVCVEAGMGLDQAIQRIGREIHISYPDLSEELNLYGLEVQAGRSRADALRNLGMRTGVEDLKVLSAVLIQADRFGTSIAQSLRIFSDDLRTKRRQRAEERAAKMSVKMIPPMLLFIFPAIFVVVVGPAVISIVRDLFRFLGN